MTIIDLNNDQLDEFADSTRFLFEQETDVADFGELGNLVETQKRDLERPFDAWPFFYT